MPARPRRPVQAERRHEARSRSPRRRAPSLNHGRDPPRRSSGAGAHRSRVRSGSSPSAPRVPVSDRVPWSAPETRVARAPPCTNRRQTPVRRGPTPFARPCLFHRDAPWSSRALRVRPPSTNDRIREQVGRGTALRDIEQARSDLVAVHAEVRGEHRDDRPERCEEPRRVPSRPASSGRLDIGRAEDEHVLAERIELSLGAALDPREERSRSLVGVGASTTDEAEAGRGVDFEEGFRGGHGIADRDLDVLALAHGALRDTETPYARIDVVKVDGVVEWWAMAVQFEWQSTSMAIRPPYTSPGQPVYWASGMCLAMTWMPSSCQ